MEITRYTPGNGQGSIQAYVSFYIPQWKLHLNDMRLILSKQGHRFLAAPSKKYEDENGEAKYAPFFCFDKEMDQRFQKSAKEAIEEYAKKLAEPVVNETVEQVEDLPF